jgi:hypothetical protein
VNKSWKINQCKLILNPTFCEQSNPSRIATFKLEINRNKTQKQMIECSEKLFNDNCKLWDDKWLEIQFFKTYSKEKRAKWENMEEKGKTPVESTNCYQVPHGGS